MSKTTKEEPIVNIEGIYSKTDRFLNQNRKAVYILIGGIVLLTGAYFGYKYYLEQQNEEAAELMWKAEYYFEVDSLDKAIKGDNKTFLGFEQIAENYSGTKTANLAEYYLGISYLNKGEFQQAIDHLQKCDLDDEIVGAIAKGSIGDAYVELGKTEEGIKYFEKAVDHSENNFTAPIYLMKSGLAFEKLGNYNKALEAYNTIKDKFPNSAEGRDIEKYIARAEARI